MSLRLRLQPSGRAPGPDRAAHELVLDGDVALLGRGPQAQVRLPDAAVSLSHARLLREGADWFITDLGSTNGTRLNGTRLAPMQRRLVRPGDRIEAPGFTIVVGSTEPGVPTTPEATVEIARRMVHDVLAALGGGDDSAPRVTVLNGPHAGAVLTLSVIGRAYRVGRGDGCDLVLADRDASREHATLTRDFAGVTLADLGSKNGVLVGRARLGAPRVLADGDELVIGATQLRYSDPAEAYLQQLEALPEAAPLSPSAPVPAAASDALPPAAAAAAPPAPAAAPAAGAGEPPGAGAVAAPVPAALASLPEDPAPAPPRATGVLLIALFAAVLALLAAGGLVLLLRST
jgi:pSer/pThr/pTyr-binding forkhead associated (FHA) protein